MYFLIALLIAVSFGQDQNPINLPPLPSLPSHDVSYPTHWDTDIANGPTRTDIVASSYSYPPTSVTITTAWAPNMERIFPSLSPQQRSDIIDAWNCDDYIEKYYRWGQSVSVTWRNTTTTTSTGTTGYLTTTQLAYLNRLTSTECDQVPRYYYSGGTPISQWITTVLTFQPKTTVYTSGLNVSTIGTLPLTSCNTTTQIPASCDSYWAISKDWDRTTDEARSQGTSLDGGWRALATCSLSWRTIRTASCRLTIGEASMFYWPPPTRTANICGPRATKELPYQYSYPTDTPVVATIDGNEYTYPFVYITYHSLSYFSLGSATRGPRYFTFDNISAVFYPHQVSSICGQEGAITTYPFDYRDMEGPVPWSAYNCLASCSNCVKSDYIDTVLSPYKPNIHYPQTLLDILHKINTYDADNCVIGANDYGVIDPPRLLTQALHLTAPAPNPVDPILTIMPITTTREPAAPSDPPTMPASQTTSAPPVPAPTRPSNGGGSDPGEDKDTPPQQPPQDPGSTSNGNNAGLPAPAPENPGSSRPDTNDPPEAAYDPPSNGARPPINAPQGASPGQVAPSPTGIAGAIISMLGGSPSRPESPSAPANDPAQPAQAIITIGTSLLPVLHLPNSAHVVGTQTYYAGDVMTTAGRTLSFQTGAVVVDASTASYVTIARFLAAGSDTSAAGAGFVPMMVNGDLLMPGQQVDISGDMVSYGPQGMVVGSRTVPLPTGKGTSMTLDGGQVVRVARVTALPGDLAPVTVDGQVVMPGRTVTVGGQIVSYGSGGVVVGSRTMPVPVGGEMSMTLDGGRVVRVAMLTSLPGDMGGAMGGVVASVLSAYAAEIRTAGAKAVSNGGPQKTGTESGNGTTSPGSRENPTSNSSTGGTGSLDRQGQPSPSIGVAAGLARYGALVMGSILSTLLMAVVVL
ncbi:Hypothetical protein D9617_13g099690 [Elsinoe fawcettii]|nr:Hypothetical protein D9617_13g099690 [Elsinoe fawcettii]